MQLRNPKTRDIDKYIDAELYLEEDDEWIPNTSLPGQEKYDRLKAGEFGEVQIIESSLDEEKTKAKKEVEQYTQNQIQPILTEYPDFERESWPQQVDEAQKYLQDSTVQTLLLSTIVQSRGQNETVSELAQKVVTKAGEFKIQIGEAAGKRKKLLREISEAQTKDEIVNILQQINGE